MSHFNDDFDDFIEENIKKTNERKKTLNTHTYTPTTIINNIQFPIAPKTNMHTSTKQLNQLPSTPISLDKYHEVFTLFKLYITKTSHNMRLFIKPDYITNRVFQETKQLIKQLNEFINNMNKSYKHKHVDFDEILYYKDVMFVRSLYQHLVSKIIKHFRPFYKKHKTIIDNINDITNISTGAGKKNKKYKRKHTQKPKQKHTQKRTQKRTQKNKHKRTQKYKIKKNIK